MNNMDAYSSPSHYSPDDEHHWSSFYSSQLHPNYFPSAFPTYGQDQVISMPHPHQTDQPPLTITTNVTPSYMTNYSPYTPLDGGIPGVYPNSYQPMISDGYLESPIERRVPALSPPSSNMPLHGSSTFPAGQTSSPSHSSGSSKSVSPIGPEILCRWGHCRETVTLDQTSLYKHLREHMAHEPLTKGSERVCRWIGCVCAAKTGANGRCHGQPAGKHPTHVQSVEQHVYDVHCGLRWPCNRCSQADFTTERSMKRHQASGCTGLNVTSPMPLFCAMCKAQVQSQAEMNAHAPLCTMARII